MGGIYSSSQLRARADAQAARQAEAEAAIRRDLWEALRVHFLQSEAPITEAAFLHIWAQDMGMGYALSMIYKGGPAFVHFRSDPDGPPPPLLGLLWSLVPGSADGAVAGEDAYRAMRLTSVFARAANHSSELGLEADTALPKHRFLQAFAASGELAADLEAALDVQVPTAECCWELLPTAASGSVTCREFVACLAGFRPPVLVLTLQAVPCEVLNMSKYSEEQEHTALAEPEPPRYTGQHEVWATTVGGERFFVHLGAGATARDAAVAVRTIRSLNALTKVMLMRADGSLLKETDPLPAALLPDSAG